MQCIGTFEPKNISSMGVASKKSGIYYECGNNIELRKGETVLCEVIPVFCKSIEDATKLLEAYCQETKSFGIGDDLIKIKLISSASLQSLTRKILEEKGSVQKKQGFSDPK